MVVLHGGQRVVVVGTAGAGKSYFSRQLAEIMQIPTIALDQFFWQSNWETVPDDVFEARLAEALAQAGDAWIVDGNYRGAGDMTFPRATAMIWLDYPVWIIYRRLIWRTIRQIMSRQPVHFDNRQTIQSAFWGWDAFVPWVIRTHGERRQPYLNILEGDRYPHMQVFHFTHPRQADAFLTRLAMSQNG